MGRFDGKTYLVTGASSGVGRAVSIRLAKEGARVVLVGRNEQELKNTLQSMDRPQEHLALPFDLLQLEDYGTLFQRIGEEGFSLNGLVHCAGTTKVLPLRVMSYENSLEQFKIHYFSFIELVKRFTKNKTSNGGSIVAISSVNAHTAQKCMTAYASAKAAVETACMTLAVELAEKDIRINAVALGGYQSGMVQKTHQMVEGILEMKTVRPTAYTNPYERHLLTVKSDDEITGPIAFLLSEDSAHMTGHTIYLDGGVL